MGCSSTKEQNKNTHFSENSSISKFENIVTEKDISNKTETKKKNYSKLGNLRFNSKSYSIKTKKK